MKIVRDSAVRQEPAQPQAVSPEENRFSIRPRQIALFFLWMLAFTLLARGTSGALLPEVQLSTPAPNTITQSLTATGTIQWAAGSLFYLPEGLLVEAVFVSEGEAVQEGDKIAALRREDVEQKLRSLQAELAQKQTEYARLTKPVAADSYDLEKAQQALQAAYQAAENSAAAWAEKEANAGSERDALQRELNERQEKAAQYAREIAEKQAQRELLQQEESPDEEIISRIEAELTQLTAEETQNREALAEAEARLNEADAALESVQSQREEAARTAAQAAEQAEQARNDARHAYEKSVEAASETAAANAASATVLAEQIREMESSVETLKKLDEQEGVFCAPQTGTVESLQLMQGQTSGQVGGSISAPERGYQIRFALEAEDAVQDTAGVTVTVMQGAKSESVKINSSVSQQDGGVVLSAALTGSDWQVGKAELTIRLSETEYDCCLPVSALHSDNGGDFVYSVEERNTILGLQNIVRKVYVEVVERNNELAALRNYTTGAPVVAATTKSLQEGARVRTAGRRFERRCCFWHARFPGGSLFGLRGGCGQPIRWFRCAPTCRSRGGSWKRCGLLCGRRMGRARLFPLFGARQRDRRKAAGKPAGSLPFYIAASMTRCILPCFWRGGSPLRRRMANARSQPLPRGSSGAARTCWGRNWR